MKFFLKCVKILFMKDNDNLHLGHRERMVQKILSAPDGILDHELLEVLLYSSLPRIDTNAIAHKLIQMFGSIEGVFSASIDKLRSVKGIGEKTAANIYVIGVIARKINFNNAKKAKNSLEALKKDLINYFANETTEKSIIMLFDEKFVVLTTLVYKGASRTTSSCDVSEVVNAIALHKPKYALLAHNHLSGALVPSTQDDYTTKKINLVCDLNGVNFVDHVIVAKDKFFSYRTEGRLDYIKEHANLESVIKKL